MNHAVMLAWTFGEYDDNLGDSYCVFLIVGILT